MVFSSSIFLFLYLPIVLTIYYLSPNKWKNFIILLSSLFFYAWGENKIVFVLIISIIVDYYCAIVIDLGWRKLGLLLSIIFNLSLLAYFKYFGFVYENYYAFMDSLGLQSSSTKNIINVTLPLGISFFTFQTMSYTIDVYRGHVRANRNIIEFATYVAMFPQLVAGPIVRYVEIQKRLKERSIKFENIASGIERFVIGLAKKVLIANTFALIADDIFAQEVSDLSSFHVWLAILSYTFQIFFDFSGYSDMAIGLGKMFGFNFLENFNYPYISKSIREFWRRWHISLSTWFRDYVYISLGGNRFGIKRTYINLFIVFFITGLWHGASWNFVIWGLFHGVFIVIERTQFNRVIKKMGAFTQHSYTLLVVMIGWVFFRAENLQVALLYIQKMFSFSSGDLSLSSYLDFFHLNLRTLFFIVIAILFSVPLEDYLNNKLKVKLTNQYIKPIFLLFIFLLSITYIGAGSYNPFIYFKF